MAKLGKQWIRHPFFPIGLFVLASLALEENYPFSEFAMYSNPTTRPLHYHYLIDENGGELPILTTTRISPAKVSKMFNKACKRENERKEGKLASEKKRNSAAGYNVLEFLYKESMKLGKKRHLPQPIELIEVSVVYGENGFREDKEVIAKYP